jgi:hypothetical protein
VIRRLALLFLAGCTAGPTAPPAPIPEASAASEVASDAPASASEAAAPSDLPGTRLGLELTEPSRAIGPGLWAIVVKVSGESYVTLGLRGPREALRRFELVPPRNLRRLRPEVYEEDGRLPVFVSFETPAGDHELTLVIDVDAPTELFRASTPVQAALEEASPLVGLPFPIESYAGYFMQYPHRYQFVRADVALALRQAFRQTRHRFGSGAFGIGDASQWNGIKPASDIGHPRHISHQGGRDIDIALPGEKGLWKIERRCDGVLVDKQVLRCSPGTVRNFDARRLAFFLAQLIDNPTKLRRDPRTKKPPHAAIVDVIFTDEAYIEAIRRELDDLRNRGWIRDEAHGALGEEGLLRPSPWHTDHVHVRFLGAPGAVASVLSFDADEQRGGAAPEIVSGPQ